MLSNLFLRNCLIPQKWCWIELEYWPPEGLILCARLSAQITHLPCFNLIAGKRKRNYSDCKKCNMNSVFIILTFFLAGSCGGVCVVQTCCCGGDIKSVLKTCQSVQERIDAEEKKHCTICTLDLPKCTREGLGRREDWALNKLYFRPAKVY